MKERKGENIGTEEKCLESVGNKTDDVIRERMMEGRA